MNQQTTSTTASNGQSTLHELFTLTDEQILEIEPEAQEEVASGESRVTSQEAPGHTDRLAPLGQAEDATKSAIKAVAANRPSSTSHESPVTSHAEAEPPQWVAEVMNDPQRGGEARAFWENSQKAQQEAAAYREVFAKPEEARSAAEQARVFEEIDRAYFGATGNSAEQTNAARAQLAQLMLRENPAAFREMVFAGLRALEETGKQGSTDAGNGTAAADRNETAAHAGQQSSHDSSAAGRNISRPLLGMTENNSGRDAQLTAYAAFERAANQELEQSVGGAIELTLDQALPNANRADSAAMKSRLATTIRQDIEKALQDDRQLGQQIAQILAARRLSDESRAQVVRLIGERARQLVPGAAKRVLQDWTQTTLATHRSRTRQNETAAARSDLAPANSSGTNPRLQAGDNTRPSARNDNRGGKGTKVDYRKLSDEQILEM